MHQTIVAATEGLDYDWSNDRITIKTPVEATDGRLTLAEDRLKPGFLLARHYHRKTMEVFFVLDGTVVFTFDDETSAATPGTVVNIPPGVWHEVTCEAGGRLLTIFTPGGFDHYLAALAALDERSLADAEQLERLAEQYDHWTT
jgi:quercetin dioxygenase-like cupin family protein